MAKNMGGKVEAQKHREYGAALVEVTAAGKKDPLTKNLSNTSRVWMSHGDSVTKIPDGGEMLLTTYGPTGTYPQTTPTAEEAAP